ncbi:MAG TPA: tRNA (adenosine(37)-N6)-dimethylallyltransferase MiaA [Bacteroidales bacterium]|nr:tRNA (adenosine(37)-N6)-dimethylallyltransferase MiaA [Bacteroidales bacterium]
MKNFLIVILGPTGVGKSELSVEVASHFNTEIISADSRQFYREMTIGTAVPNENQLHAVKHHFIQFLSVKDYFSSSLFERAVLELLPSLFSKNRIVVMSGGSGMYIDAVCKGIDEIPDIDHAVRNKYNEKFISEGIEILRRELRIVDPEYYAKVDLRNHKRIIRALEIFESTGRKYSEFLTKKDAIRDFSIIKIGLERERDNLYTRINLRVDAMIENGLEGEARGLFQFRELNPLKSVGYREFYDFFEGKTSREKAVELIKRNSRRYAKRQITWWSRDKEIVWFSPERKGEIIRYITERTG